jgi:hypothetical protein
MKACTLHGYMHKAATESLSYYNANYSHKSESNITHPWQMLIIACNIALKVNLEDEMVHEDIYQAASGVFYDLQLSIWL